jgi:hypothetical protein
MTQTDHAKEKQHKSSAARVKAYRARQKAKGLREVTHWVIDTTTSEFKAEAKRQCEALAKSKFAAEDQAFVDAISEDIWNEPW